MHLFSTTTAEQMLMLGKMAPVVEVCMRSEEVAGDG
jgi:hypothetical protein